MLIWLYLSNCCWLIGGSGILLGDLPATLFLNDIGELGEAFGGRAVNELVMVTICCRGLPPPAAPTPRVVGGWGEKGIKGGGGPEVKGFEDGCAPEDVGGVEEPPKVSSDLVSRSSALPQLLSLSRLSFVKS